MDRPLFKAAVSEIGIDRSDPEPIQSQISRQLRELVLTGRLKPQTKLPSTRGLAQELAVARATIVEAYEQLLGEGYLEARKGSGTRVAAELPEALLASAPLARPLLRAAKPKREPARPFRTGLVDWDHFPHDEWGRLLGRSWRNPPISLLEHNDAFGFLKLREAIAQHLYEWRGISCGAEQVIVTSGGADAFDLINRAVFREGNRIWFEEPGYSTARRVFMQGGVRPVVIGIDGDGLKVAEGLRKAPAAQGAFVTPARQYPTGVTMPLSRRLELLDWAASAKATVIEDDYDSEYRYVGRPLPALMSLDRAARVIYSGTFSKVFSPILRLGYLVVPVPMLPRFRQARHNHGAPPSLIVQPALAEFMQSGAFAVHIRRMRRIYAARRAALIDALAPGDGCFFTIDAAPSGLMLMLRLPDDWPDTKIAEALASRGVETLPLSGHYGGAVSAQGLLLSFAGFSESELKAAAQRLLSYFSQEPKGVSSRKSLSRMARAKSS